MDRTDVPTIKYLYPNLHEQELQLAEENLERYFLHALRMYERIRKDSAAYAEFTALTASMKKLYDEPHKVDFTTN